LLAKALKKMPDEINKGFGILPRGKGPCNCRPAEKEGERKARRAFFRQKWYNIIVMFELSEADLRAELKKQR